MSACAYDMGGGGAFKAEEVAGANAQKQESRPNELREQLWWLEWRTEGTELWEPSLGRWW